MTKKLIAWTLATILIVHTLPSPAGLNTTTMVFFVAQIQVLTNRTANVVVTLGDSITDGACSNVDADGNWPDLLAKRLATLPGARFSVLNADIG